MFYSGTDISTDLASKVQGGQPVDTSVPSFDSFNSNLFSILPQNLFSYDSQGVPQLLNPTNMQGVLDQAVSTILPQIASSTTALFDSLKGINPIVTQANQAFQQLEATSNQLLKILEDFSKGVSMQTNQTLFNNTQFTQLGSLNQSIDSSYPSFTQKGFAILMILFFMIKKS